MKQAPRETVTSVFYVEQPKKLNSWTWNLPQKLWPLWWDRANFPKVTPRIVQKKLF